MSNTILQMALADGAIELWGLGGSTWGNLISGGTDATLVNTPDKAIGSPGLERGVGLDLDGISMHATIGTAMDGLSGSAWTIGCAFIPKTNTLSALIASHQGGAKTGAQISQLVTTGQLRITAADGTTTFNNTSSNAANLNQVNTVFARLNTTANELDITLNGTVSSPTAMATTIINGNNPGQIGRIHTGTQLFKGIIQTIILIPSALTDARITQYRNAMIWQASNWHLQPGMAGGCGF